MIREIPAKLAFFQPEFVADAVESTIMEDHLPIGFSATNQGNPIRFYIRGSEMWIDLEKSYFEIEGKIEGVDAATVPVAAHTSTSFSLTNNFLHNLFNSIHINVNESPVTFSNDNYPYIAYIQNLYNYPSDYQDTIGDVYLWKKDTAGHMNASGRNITTNRGAAERSFWVTDQDKVRGIMKLHSPLMMITPYLLSFLDLDIVMNRTENAQFYFMSAAGSTFTFRLDSIVFRVRKAKLVPSFVEGVEQMLHKQKESITYPLRDCRVTTKTYSGYGADIIEDNLFHGVLPTRIVIGIVSNNAYKGDFRENPFNFVHKNIKEIGIFLNGTAHPIPMTQMDFATKATHNIYHLMLEAMQAAKPQPGQSSVCITKKEFDEGFTLFNFDMSSDQHGGFNHQSLFNQPANIRLHLRFRQGDVADLITLIIYNELSSRMLVNASRQVSTYAK